MPTPGPSCGRRMAVQRSGSRSSEGWLRLTRRHHGQLVEVDVRLVEAVEEHEAVGARLDDPAREVGEGRVVGAQLDGQGQARPRRARRR